jgi:hypothetical protein
VLKFANRARYRKVVADIFVFDKNEIRTFCIEALESAIKHIALSLNVGGALEIPFFDSGVRCPPGHIPPALNPTLKSQIHARVSKEIRASVVKCRVTADRTLEASNDSTGVTGHRVGQRNERPPSEETRQQTNFWSRTDRVPRLKFLCPFVPILCPGDFGEAWKRATKIA